MKRQPLVGTRLRLDELPDAALDDLARSVEQLPDTDDVWPKSDAIREEQSRRKRQA